MYFHSGSRMGLPSTPVADNLANAIKCAELSLVRRLLEKGHDPNIHIESGTFLLEFACLRKETEIVKVLLEFGSDPDLCGFDSEDVRPLHIAASYGCVEIIEALVKAGADIETLDQRGWTPLHRAVERSQESSVKSLLKLGANPNSKCRNPRVKLLSGDERFYLGCIPLMTAIEIQSAEIVNLLLQTNKVDIEYVAGGTSNLILALVKEELEIVEQLLKAGANPQLCNRGRTALSFAYDTNSVDLLLNFGAHPDGCQDPSCKHRFSLTPLLTCINQFSREKTLSCARLLIHRGCDLNCTTFHTFKTPLDEALTYRHLSVAKTLIIYGCNVSQGNIKTFTHLGNESQDIKDFCNLWLFTPQPLSHLCCLKIRKILKFDFEKKLNTISSLTIPVPVIRNITMQDIYEGIQ